MKAAQSKIVDIHADFEIPVELYASDGSRETISARIRRVNHGFFPATHTQALEVGRHFIMECDSCQADLEVIYCQRPAVGACFVGARLLSADEASSRKEVRLLVNIPATATVPGTFERANAVLKSLSATSIDVLVPEIVEDGSMVAVDIGHGIVFGESKRCTRVESGQYQVETTIDEFLPRDNSSTTGKNVDASPGFFSRLKNVFFPR